MVCSLPLVDSNLVIKYSNGILLAVAICCIHIGSMRFINQDFLVRRYGADTVICGIVEPGEK